MQERLRYGKAYPDAYKAMLALSQAVEKTGLALQLIDLVNYRVSQLNGCAFCLDMHSKDLRARGETEQRLYMISAWREVPHLYSDRERAALEWAEAITRLEGQQVPDAIYDIARREFSEAELAQLTLAVVAINGWNRFNVAFHTPAGDYKSAAILKSGPPILTSRIASNPVSGSMTRPRANMTSSVDVGARLCAHPVVGTAA
jgi:AhpD family alkylhydroperoxidase